MDLVPWGRGKLWLEPSLSILHNLEVQEGRKGIETLRITRAEIEAQKTANGGWTKKTLDQWGVPWPPKKGWKADLIKNGVRPIPGLQPQSRGQ